LKLFYIYRRVEKVTIVNGTHPFYYYAIALVLANSDNFARYLKRALEVYNNRGMLDEVNRDINIINEEALKLYDKIALPESIRIKKTKHRLNEFKDALKDQPLFHKGV
jgi:hypothetical protein